MNKELLSTNQIKYILGRGPKPARVMVIAEAPTQYAMQSEQNFNTNGLNLFISLCNKNHINISEQTAYFTYAVKYSKGLKTLTSADITQCKSLLINELQQVQPEIVVCLGQLALRAIVGTKYSFSNFRGIVINTTFEQYNIKVLPTFDPDKVLDNSWLLPIFNYDIRTLYHLITNTSRDYPPLQYMEIKTNEQLHQFVESMLNKNCEFELSLDVEWHGKNWMDPNRYIRTIQFGIVPGFSIVIRVTDEGNTPCITNVQEMLYDLKRFLEHPKIKLIGHNIIADGEWLLSYGIDIRKNVIYDTMLAEHVINESGPFGLEALVCKYTNFNRYDSELLLWKLNNNTLVEDGYGFVPSSILIPYAAMDVNVIFYIKEKQYPALRQYTIPRANYPSLWEIELETQRILYELECTGMLVDKDRLNQITDAYANRLNQLETMLISIAKQHGIVDLNYRSQQQLRHFLFDVLQLKPIKTTDNKKWSELNDQDLASQYAAVPALDKTVKEILQDHHPAVKLLLHLSRLDSIFKFFLKSSNGSGGVANKIWPDGCIHAHFSQLSETGRLKASKPNIQNWPKKSEGYLSEIFGGKDKVPPLIRTILIPRKGNIFVEGDFVQAELFVLAALSNDSTMLNALTTPGKDMHDLTAITAFHLNVVDANGNHVDENYALELAKTNKEQFEKYRDGWVYINPQGIRYSRSEFKNTIRVSAKNVNFGIPYGRGAEDIAFQIKAETGSAKTLNELTAEVQELIDIWKTKTYPTAWKYLTNCRNIGIDGGILYTPWGRTRHFPTVTDSARKAAQGREAMNFTIQSTVADTCFVALWLMDRYKLEHNLHFKIVNQIHDAILVETPISELEDTKQMFYNTMGNIHIPINSTTTLKLNIDLDVYTRWGEKLKQ